MYDLIMMKFNLYCYLIRKLVLTFAIFMFQALSKAIAGENSYCNFQVREENFLNSPFQSKKINMQLKKIKPLN